ncbi:MAG: peroxiredoxin [Bacteroidota bacterium]|nr:peroxiredoxin [Candidatus Kapabacteria bacterium]MDW8074846.1 peroxiredoxin [Bacteroidota bacterium]
MALTVGDRAPRFALYDQDRTKRTLEEFLGQPVVLAFFPGAFTGVCDTEMCTLRDSMHRFSEANARVIGISVDPPFVLKEFAAKYSLPFVLLSDYTREVSQQYGVLFENLAGLEGYNTSNRAVFILDADGVIRYTWTATPTPAVEPPYDEVIAQTHALTSTGT